MRHSWFYSGLTTMTSQDLTEIAGILLGTFAIGYTAGFILLAFKRGAGSL